MSDVTSNPSRPGSPSASVMGANDLPTARPYRFVWDPSSRRPGPESVAGTTEGGRGDYITGTAQYPLGVLNNPSSLNLELGNLPSEWSSAKHGFHAISTVLNNPHKKQAPPKAHSSLPSVPPADLPRVRRKDFDSYLKAITTEWEKYEQNSQMGKEGQAQIDAARFEMPASDDEDGSDDGPSRRSTAPVSLLHGRQIPPLDSVPSVFFQPNFNLGDRLTFDSVTEQGDPTTPTPSSRRPNFLDEGDADPLSLSHSLPLLEKFSHYADTVEQHLIREISLRSTSFFAALTNLRELQTSSTACLTRIQKLREKLKEVDEGTAKKGLELVRVKRKDDRVRQVSEGAKMISSVVEMVSVAKGLVGAGQWGEALEVIEEMESMWEQTPSEEHVNKRNGNGSAINGSSKLHSMIEEREDETTESPTDEASQFTITDDVKTPARAHRVSNSVPLSSLTAFASLPAHLRGLTMEIAASLSAEFVAIMKDDWLSYVESPPSHANPGKRDPSVAGRDQDRDQSLNDRLKPLLINLVRTKGLKEGMLSWREVVLVEIKGFIVKKFPGFNFGDGDAANGSGLVDSNQSLANHLRGLSQSDFTALMKEIYRSLLNGIERLKAQGDIIAELVKSSRPELQTKSKERLGTQTSKSQAPFPIAALEEDLADILSSTAELANTQTARIISYRSELHSKLELLEFMLFFNDSWAFVVRCEVLCRRMIVGLRGTVVSQAKLWLQTFHQARITQSAKLVEDEVWDVGEVTKQHQRVASIIIDAAVSNPPELIVSPESQPSPNSPEAPGTAPVPDSAVSPGPASASEARVTPASRTKQLLRIEDRGYHMVSSTSEILTLLLDYLKVIVNMNMLTTDAMSRVIEFMKAYNSRTCQVVLGAGAMRSAGLRNITAKHLALASQSLSIMSELIPYIRETFRRHLSQIQAVMLVEFDRLKRDYQEHQNEIHLKLIVIMRERLDSHIKTLKTIDWTLPNDGGGANEYMMKLVKETVTLHKILARYLATPVVEFVMSEVLAAINHRLSEEYGKIDLPSQQAKERMLEDAKYLHQNFSGLRHVRAPTGMLETVVAEKDLPRPKNATPTRSNTMSNANQRLRGLLSGRPSLGPDTNSSPNVSQTTSGASDSHSTSNSTSPPQSVSTSSLAATNQTTNGLSNLGSQGSLSGSSLSLATEEPVTRPSGFTHIDISSKPDAK
ncbi:Vps54-domain-containing protein [Coprinopsis marcescibilis]|uniref:Vps54-domain-containing protein n=1 Tax=Coprinopsis marcescibilis TaxID=230819 RepID=A0A5C3LAP4_COPMA|nr:Vps54-domain-containing protein [Coprinopsis marcescibilis]